MFTFLLPKDKKLFKYIFFLAVPVILSNISRVMMGLADTVMVGHLGSKAYCWSRNGFNGYLDSNGNRHCI